MDETERDAEDEGFREAQEGDYEPEPVIHDPDDLPVDEDDDEDDRRGLDDDRPVPLDPDDAELT